MTALMYHDVVPPGCDNASGFPGRDAALYKVTPETFEAHLEAINKVAARLGLVGDRQPAITFDDGGISALYAADLLDSFGLRGHFFVTVDYIGTRGFLAAADLCELHTRGHIVGSHSCSHPLRMGHCPAAQLAREWTVSRATLSDLLGVAVATASVPGGDYATRVAQAAAHAGFAELFTSEPTSRTNEIDRIAVRGRYTIQRWTTADTAAALAAGAWLPRASQAVVWNAKKLSKRLGGDAYLRLRKLLLQHGDEVRWGDARR